MTARGARFNLCGVGQRVHISGAKEKVLSFVEFGMNEATEKELQLLQLSLVRAEQYLSGLCCVV